MFIFLVAGLLSLSASENKTIDELPYLTDEEKEERKSSNCTPPAIEQFPEPLMDNYYRKCGGIIIHILVAIYMFIGLAIVCDDYFVPALDRIAEGKISIFINQMTYSLQIYSLLIYQYSIKRKEVDLYCRLLIVMLQ